MITPETQRRSTETLNEARGRLLLEIAVAVSWYLEITPASDASIDFLIHPLS